MGIEVTSHDEICLTAGLEANGRLEASQEGVKLGNGAVRTAVTAIDNAVIDPRPNETKTGAVVHNERAWVTRYIDCRLAVVTVDPTLVVTHWPEIVTDDCDVSAPFCHRLNQQLLGCPTVIEVNLNDSPIRDDCTWGVARPCAHHDCIILAASTTLAKALAA